MQPLWKNLFFVFIIFVAGCTRATKPNLSKLSIQTPRDAFSSEKGSLQTMGTFPSGRKACYAVNITAGDIPAVTSASCSFPMGLTAGFVEEGQTIQLEVPRGENRKIELYAFLYPTGDNSSCPEFVKTLTPQQMASTYRVAVTGNVSMVEPEVTVEMQMDFPGVAQNISQQLGLPAGCATPQVNRLNGFTVSSSKATATGGAIVMHGRVGRVTNAPVLTGTGIQLRVAE